MNAEFLQRVILRDLAALREEVRAYQSDDDLWVCPDGIVNSAGTLVLHLVGNMLHFIGAQLGGTGYVRNREAEFNTRGVSRAELERQIDQAIETIAQTLSRLSDDDLNREYPLEVGRRRLSTGLFLTHLAAHLAYHLGQVDYHRRTVTKQPEGVGAQSIAALVDE